MRCLKPLAFLEVWDELRHQGDNETVGPFKLKEVALGASLVGTCIALDVVFDKV